MKIVNNNLVDKALIFAAKAHQGQYRRNPTGGVSRF